jgi:penicillin-binding protein 1A
MMQDQGYITEAMAKVALAAGRGPRAAGAGSVNYAADWVMDVLDETSAPSTSDIVVTTTSDAAMQNAAEKALTDELWTSQGAPRIVEPGRAGRAWPRRRGARRWWAGATMPTASSTAPSLAKRQPGSAFKPFVYLTALESGLTPDTMREDSPSTSRAGSRKITREYFGPVTLTRALVDVAQHRGGEARAGGRRIQGGGENGAAARHRIRRCLNASIALGTSEVTPLELSPPMRPSPMAASACSPYHRRACARPTARSALRAQGVEPRPRHRAAIWA